MFLPIIMLRDWGWPGFLVFAIPNVLGCAAFGYVLKTRARSEALLKRHGWAARIFSIATICYHMFFIAFLTMRLDGGSESIRYWPELALIGAVVVIGVPLRNLSTRFWPIAAVFVYLISIATFMIIGVDPLQEIAWTGERAPIELAWVAPAIIFGFLLCPYLDLTFHRALRESPSKHCFSVFGVTFAVMILLTCAYFGLGETPIGSLFATPWPGRLLVAHLFAQIIFTFAAHAREVRLMKQQEQAQPPPEHSTDRAMFSSLELWAAAIILAGVMLTTLLPAQFQFSYAWTEDIYLRWLALYGLVFPAYVLIFIGPWKPKALNRANLIRFAIILLALAPLYELGFIHGWTAVLPFAVALLLSMAWMTPRTAPQLESN